VDAFKLLPLPPEYAIDAGTPTLSPRRDTVAVPVFWIVLLLSLLVHVAVLYFVPPLRFDLRPGIDPQAPLAVELRPRREAPKATVPVPKPKSTPPVAAAPSAPPPRLPLSPRRVVPPMPPAVVAPSAPAERSAPPVSAPAQPAPEAKQPVLQAEPVTPERVAPSRAGDLASYIEAQRRARRASASPPVQSSEEPAQVDEDARRNRIVAENLGLGRTPSFGGPPRQGGGVFQITRLYYSNAEFAFFGWNKDIRRNTSQLIEVRKGQHSDIKLAVIRRMIAIIRDHESGDFLWESTRLGRDVMLSARPADNAGLEEFLMREFFDEGRREMGSAERFQR
jgi:hypothetical protein